MKLMRIRNGRMLGGVCGGLAKQFGWDVTVLRILTFVGALFAGITVFIYVALWLLMPQEDF